jgi:hypothetical protein
MAERRTGEFDTGKSYYQYRSLDAGLAGGKRG